MSSTNSIVRHCHKCGSLITTTFKQIGGDVFCPMCSAIPEWNVGNDMGWRCPNCGRGNSPFVKQCDCIPYVPTWTTTDI